MANEDFRLDLLSERRTTRRFRIEQEVLYRILDNRTAVPDSGAGRTLDISSGGVLFGTEQRLRTGKRVELSVNWPVALEGGCPLKFIAMGRVVWAEDTRAAMHIEQYEFRTRRKEIPAVVAAKPARTPVPYY